MPADTAEEPWLLCSNLQSVTDRPLLCNPRLKDFFKVKMESLFTSMQDTKDFIADVSVVDRRKHRQQEKGELVSQTGPQVFHVEHKSQKCEDFYFVFSVTGSEIVEVPSILSKRQHIVYNLTILEINMGECSTCFCRNIVC